MIVEFIANSDLNEFKKSLQKIEKKAKSILILSCDENNYDISKLNNALKSCSIPLIGGVFPQIIYQNKNYTKGTIIASLEDTIDVKSIDNISKIDSGSFEDIIEEKFAEISPEVKTMFVFIDGLSKNINSLISGLFENYGLSLNYIGGGAGSLSFEQKPCLFTNDGIKIDCAVLATSVLKSSVGVKHGWKAISEPLKITLSEGNVVKEIDYKPAFEVYKGIVEPVSGERFDKKNFFDIAKGYPLGINKLSAEMVVRDPIKLDKENSLVCVGDVAMNSFVSILKGTTKSLVNAVVQAKKESFLQGESFTLFIDCISRVLFMESNFLKELEAVNEENRILIGALTLGEIANNKKYYLEFYNKTAVVAKIEK